MLSYTAGDTDVPLLEETIGANFERIAARFPLRDALIEAAVVPGGDARRWSYQKLNDDVDRLARAMLAMGVAKGERIGIWSPNCAEWTILQYATAKIGAVLVNVNPAYRSHELEFVVKQNGMRMLVAAASDKHSDYVAWPGMRPVTVPTSGRSSSSRESRNWDSLRASRKPTRNSPTVNS